MNKSLNFLKIVKERSKTIIFGFFVMFLALFFINQSFAKITKSKGIAKIVKESPANTAVKDTPTTDIIDRIERVLSAPEGSIIETRKSEFKLNRSNPDAGQGANIESNQESGDGINRIKEKAAYNATISGQYEAALELYKQILKTEEDNNYAKFGLATSYHKLKQYKEAKKTYYELLAADVDNKDEIIGNLLEILVEESPLDAKYLLSRLSAQSPNADYILARTALTYSNLNNKNEAVLLLKRAIAINPNNIEYKMNLAIILDQNNENEEALKYYKETLADYIKSGSDSELDLDTIKKRIEFLETK